MPAPVHTSAAQLTSQHNSVLPSSASGMARKPLPTDGFVSSAGNKELGRKYGHDPSGIAPVPMPQSSSSPAVGTLAGATLPAVLLPGPSEPVSIGAPVLSTGPSLSTAAVTSAGESSSSAAPVDLARLSSDRQAIAGTLMRCGAALEHAGLVGMDKKQLPEIQKANELVIAKLAAAELSTEVLARLSALCTALESGDHRSALAMHVQLTTSDWERHKDWLRGLKFLIQLCQKKL